MDPQLKADHKNYEEIDMSNEESQMLGNAGDVENAGASAPVEARQTCPGYISSHHMILIIMMMIITIYI